MFLRRNKLSLTERTRTAINPQKGHVRIIHYIVWRLKRLPGTPEFIARGLAIGIAINFWPVLFTHLIIGYFLCRMMRGSFIAFFIGQLFGNPWTFAILFPIQYKIGKVLMGLRPTHRSESLDSMEEVWAKIWPVESWSNLWYGITEIILPMILGGFLLALPCTILCYYVSRNMVRVYHAQRRKHLQRRFDSVEAEIENNNPHVS